MVIAGVVRDSEGFPVADARVYLIAAPGPFPDIAGLTDARGTFTLGARIPGEYQIGCTATGHGSTSETIVVRSGQDVQVEISFP